MTDRISDRLFAIALELERLESKLKFEGWDKRLATAIATLRAIAREQLDNKK